MLSSGYSGGFVINTNMASLLVQRNLANVTNDMTALMEHLSTNLKVNRASDDPSGLAISLNYERQISSMTVASNNSQTGVSLLQTAENDLKTIQSNLSTMKNLAIQARTGTTSDADRVALNANFQQLLQEIERISTTSNYSGKNLLDGTNSAAGTIVLQVDINSGGANTIDISSALASARTGALAINTQKVSTVVSATAAQTAIENAYNTISQQISLVGGLTSRLTNNIKRLATRSENLKSANSLIRDTDVAADTAKLTRAQILQSTAATLIQQANSSSALILTLIGAN